MRWKNRTAVKRCPDVDMRWYQEEVLRAFDSGYRYLGHVWHRRAGKDLFDWNLIIRECVRGKRLGAYNYVFPTRVLGNRVIWNGADKAGRRYLDYIPWQTVKRAVANEMLIEFKNGCILQIVGSDKSINVGINTVGWVFSEFSLQDPNCWEYVRPIIRENQGWAVFNGTPRGKNHMFDLYEHTKESKQWYWTFKTYEDTGVFTQEDIDAEREAGMSEAKIQQEFMCSWEGSVEGAFYSKVLGIAEHEGRIGHVPYDERFHVYAAFDLGRDDATSVVLYQFVGQQINIIDHYENRNHLLPHYLDWIERHNYPIGRVFLPHDGGNRNVVSEYTPAALVEHRGWSCVILQETRSDGIDRINHVRALFPRMFFDKVKTDYLIKCLSQYHQEYDSKSKSWRQRAEHDWSSHACEAMAVLAYSQKYVGKDMSADEYRELQKKHGISRGSKVIRPWEQPKWSIG